MVDLVEKRESLMILNEGMKNLSEGDVLVLELELELEIEILSLYGKTRDIGEIPFSLKPFESEKAALEDGGWVRINVTRL